MGERRIFQIGPIQPGEFDEIGHAEGAGHGVDLIGTEVQVLRKNLADLLRH